MIARERSRLPNEQEPFLGLQVGFQTRQVHVARAEYKWCKLLATFFMGKGILLEDLPGQSIAQQCKEHACIAHITL